VPRKRTDEPREEPVRRRPATTPEARQNQMINLAVSLAETQMTDGTASAQVITHYLKLGTERERLENERLRHENELLKAKVESFASAKRTEELYESALNAMRSYQGQPPLEMPDDFDD
jgi:cell shape-determining protein MreC